MFTSLSEYVLATEIGEKPLVVLTLLRHHMHKELSFVFASIVTFTHRLCRLLHLYGLTGIDGYFSLFFFFVDGIVQ